MEGVELAIPAVVTVPKLMGSEVLVGARVCGSDREATESCEAVSTLSSVPLLSHRGTSGAPESYSWIKKTDTELFKSNGLLSRLPTEDVSHGMDHGTPTSSMAFMSGSEGKQIQRRVGKVPRNGSSSIKKLHMLQADNLVPLEADDTKMESDKIGAHLVKCSNADKSVTVKPKSNINGRRGDRRNHKVQMKSKYDPFSLKAGLPSFSPANGGSNVFGMYGLKPDTHDVTKLMDDISLDELLDGSFKCPTQGRDKGKKAVSVNENILDSVRKVCSILRPRGLQQSKQPEEVDIHATKKVPLLSSPSDASAADDCDGDDSSHTAGVSKSSNDQESCRKAEAPTDKNVSPLYQPREVLERLSLPPSKDLDSLLQDAMKPAAPGKLSDSRSGKPFSHRVSLPPFPWSNNFSGHHKTNNDATRLSNKSMCQGRWVRIRSTASLIGGSNEGVLDLDSLTYDDSLVPAGKVKYRLPETENSPSPYVSQRRSQQDLSSALCSTASMPPCELAGTSVSRNAAHSPTVLVAAETLCELARITRKHNPNGILRWPIQPSQKAMKARKSRFNDKPEGDILTPKSEPVLDHVVSKRSKLSMIERREDFNHVHTVIGLSSVSAPRSSRSSPSRLARDSVPEPRNCSNSFPKPPFRVPPAPRVLDRSNNNPQKLRKIGPMDWNRSRS